MKDIKQYLNESIHNWQRFEPAEDNDQWTEKCLELLKDKYGSKYKVEHCWSGDINFYQKGRKPSLRSLICSLRGLCDGELAADFGPNKDLEGPLGKEILDLIKSIK